MPAPMRSQPRAPDERWSLNEVAERLGVHYMTAYRYVRAGQLEAVQEGGVWHVSPEAVETFCTRRGAAAIPAGRRPKGETRPPKATARRVATLADRMVAGDEAGAWSVVESAVASGTPLEQVYLTLLRRALTTVGDRWERGSIGIADEHRASVVAMRVVGRLGPRCVRRGRPRGTVVLSAAPGDRHGLPTALLADVLRYRGFRVVDLGADLPAAELAEAAASEDRLLAVGVCATSTPDGRAARELARMVSSLQDRVARPVLLGGAAVDSPERAADLGAVHWSTGAETALAFFEALVPEPEPVRRSG